MPTGKTTAEGRSRGSAPTAEADASTATQVAVFAALADDTRWDILTRLGRAPASASGLAAELPVSRQAIARHLGVLEEVGLVSAQRHGRELRYAALGARLATVAADLERIASAWERRLESIKAAAESED